jgi:hypothetical protein
MPEQERMQLTLSPELAARLDRWRSFEAGRLSREAATLQLLEWALAHVERDGLSPRASSS